MGATLPICAFPGKPTICGPLDVGNGEGTGCINMPCVGELGGCLLVASKKSGRFIDGTPGVDTAPVSDKRLASYAKLVGATIPTSLDIVRKIGGEQLRPSRT